MTGMRVFIIGGATGDSSDTYDWKDFGKRIGSLLGQSEHRAVLCSPHNSSLDFHVLTGVSESTCTDRNTKIVVHHPESTYISDSWYELAKELNISDPEYNSYESPKFINDINGEIFDKNLMQRAYLLCQLQALNDSDVMVIVGGTVEGSAIMTISLAIKKGIPILPLPFFGGAARYAFDRESRRLTETFGKQTVERFKNPNQLENIFLPMLEKIHNSKKGKKPLRVFISYAWSRAELADFIEALLRRRNGVDLFRDEMDIKYGTNIRESIDEEIMKSCDIFIALWCCDYVQSPYCYDEIEMWMAHRGHKNLYILKLDDTRPVWPKLRDSNDGQQFSSLTKEGFDIKTNKVSREKVNIALSNILEEHIQD